MIELKTSRGNAEAVRDQFFPYINLLKQTRLNNVAQTNIMSEEYLTALTINCLLTEVEDLVIKKLVNTSGQRIHFKFSDAEGIVLYRALLALPLPAAQIYLHQVRNELVSLLDQELVSRKIYQPVKRPSAIPGGMDEYDEGV